MHTDAEEPKGPNRRRFLLVTGGTTLALVLNSGLAGVSPAWADQEFIETSCRKEGMAGSKVLIAYASKCGSTGTVAQAMAQALCGLGASVDLRLADKVRDLSPYEAVMVGSAIRAGKWLSAAKGFVEDNQDALGRLPVAYFLVCYTMKDDTPENREKVLAYLDPVFEAAPRVKPLAVGLFPGVVDYAKLGFMYRTILSARGVAEGDYRNLPAVKGWATRQAPALGAGRARG
jgi:menaquinone-dependent protoporphyrinogen oxidase